LIRLYCQATTASARVSPFSAANRFILLASTTPQTMRRSIGSNQSARRMSPWLGASAIGHVAVFKRNERQRRQRPNKGHSDFVYERRLPSVDRTPRAAILMTGQRLLMADYSLQQHTVCASAATLFCAIAVHEMMTATTPRRHDSNDFLSAQD
jgi:hypothetical protein